MSAIEHTDFDIVIAGGGMIGTCLAIALEPLGFRIAVVEAVERGELQQPSFDDRSTALSRSSQRTFEAMGLWPDIVAASTPIRSIHVSEKGRFGFSHLDSEEQQVEALGYVVINRVLGGVLNDALTRQPGLRMFCPARISAVEHLDHSIVTVVESGTSVKRLQCRLLVAADGAGSTVRDMLGIGATRRDYEQSAESAMCSRRFHRTIARSNDLRAKGRWRCCRLLIIGRHLSGCCLGRVRVRS